MKRRRLNKMNLVRRVYRTSALRKVVRRLKSKATTAALMASTALYTKITYAGSDPLSGVIEENITPALGTSSTFFKLLCLAEIIGAIAAFFATKKYSVLAGVVFVALFFDVAYAHYVG